MEIYSPDAVQSESSPERQACGSPSGASPVCEAATPILTPNEVQRELPPGPGPAEGGPGRQERREWRGEHGGLPCPAPRFPPRCAGFRSHFWTPKQSPYPTVRGSPGHEDGIWEGGAHHGGQAKGTFPGDTQGYTAGILKQWPSAPRVDKREGSLQRSF